MTNNAEILTNLINNQKDIIPFLKDLNKKERKALIPTISKLHEKFIYREEKKKYFKGGGFSREWGDYKYEEKYRELVAQAGVICANTVTEFRTIFSWAGTNYLFKDYIIDDVLTWYVPKWYEKFVNHRENSFSLDYLKMMRLYKMGAFQPTDELIASKLVQALVSFDWIKGRRRAVYKLEDFFIYPETMEQHIWVLFKVNNPINSSFYNKVIPGVTAKEESVWMVTFKRLTEEGKLARERVLELSLLTCTRGFNKNQVSWFFKLFEFLEPSKEELLGLQNEFITCLNSDSSLAINIALKSLKMLVKEPGFNIDGFLSTVPQLLSLEVKKTVNTTLMILDKLASQHKAKKAEICQLAIGAFAHEEAKIQERTAKLIKKHGEVSMNLEEELLNYYTFLFSDAKVLLEAFLPKEFEEAIEEELLEEEIAIDFLSEEKKIDTLNDFDELFYFINQVLDNNNPQDVEQLLVNLPKLDKLLTTENIERLNPLLIKAFDYMTLNGRWQRSFLTTTSYFLNHYAKGIATRFPNSLEERLLHIKKKIREDAFIRQGYMSMYRKPKGAKVFELVDHLFSLSQKRINGEREVPFFSTPTHAPAWIDPETLIDRIIQFEQTDLPIDIVDWQLAIFRLPPNLNPTERLLQKIEKIQYRFFKEVLLYFFDQKEIGFLKPNKLKYYLPAIISKRDKRAIKEIKDKLNLDLYTIFVDFTFNLHDREYQVQEYDNKKKKWIFIPKIRKVLTLIPLKENRSENTLLSKLKGFTKKLRLPTGLDSVLASLDYRTVNHWNVLSAVDAKRLMMLTPTHLTPYLSQVIQYNLETSELPGEEGKRILVNALEFLNEIWFRKEENEIYYLFLATAFLCNHKIARQLVADLWLNTVEQGIIDSNKLGEIMGKLLCHNYAPLKRFTDLITTQMYNIGLRHNKALYELLSAMIAQMNEKPMTNTRKLLELYAELAVNKKIRIAAPLPIKTLEEWQKTKSLQKVIDKVTSS